MTNLRESYEKNYRQARSNLLLMLVCTAVNLILPFVNSDLRFLFSASLPELLSSVAWALVDLEMPWFLPAMPVAAIVLLMAAYVLCWLFSKCHGGWMVAALVLFSVDCVATLWIVAMSFVQAGSSEPDLFSLGIMLVFAAWVMYYLVRGVAAWSKMRKLPPCEEPAMSTANANE